jgi:hypothetical protein
MESIMDQRRAEVAASAKEQLIAETQVSQAGQELSWVLPPNAINC